MDWKTGLAPVLALDLVPGLGSVMIRQLVAYTGSPEEALQAPVRILARIPGIGEVLAKKIKESRTRVMDQAWLELEKVIAEGAKGLSYLDPGFPSRLKSIPDAPSYIFFKGEPNWNAPRILAIVGTRNCTNYGKEAIESFLEVLLPYRPVIVSGLAYGIDISAHKTALELGLETWGVMATGIDIFYPSLHRKTALAMLEKGCVLTENPLGTGPDAPRFPARNRIIAGLSDAVWVVEAMEKGGALITARLANDYFRDVFALPGPWNQRSSMGCNQLIRNNEAALVSGGKDILDALNWNLSEPVIPSSGSESTPINPEEKVIMDLFGVQGDQHLDEIAWKTQIPVNQLASILLNMEFQGLVKCLPGKRFGPRKDSSWKENR
jgi:DNA processing protein